MILQRNISKTCKNRKVRPIVRRNRLRVTRMVGLVDRDMETAVAVPPLCEAVYKLHKLRMRDHACSPLHSNCKTALACIRPISKS